MLRAFLEYRQYKPNQIIFVDDRMDYVKSVRDTASKASIPYLGIQFTAAEAQMSRLCKERSALQLEILSKERKWLSDEEADERMK